MTREIFKVYLHEYNALLSAQKIKLFYYPYVFISYAYKEKNLQKTNILGTNLINLKDSITLSNMFFS